MNKAKLERPWMVTDEHLKYLDELRVSGVTNMMGAGIYVERQFAVSKKMASDIVIYWMESFEEREQEDA